MSFVKSPFSTAIIALNVIVFFFLQTANPAITSEYGLSDESFAETPLTAITSGFLHGDMIHLAMNMIAVFFLMSGGWEQLFGSMRYAIIYLTSLLGGSAAVLMWSADNSITVGASGAIYGLMGALVGGVIRAHKDVSDIANMLVPIGGYILINLGLTFTNPVISWQAHVGGLVTGFVVSLLLGVKKPKPLRPKENMSHEYR